MALADVFLIVATLARETFAVSTVAARRKRRRFLTACAFGLGVSGVGLATVVSRADEPQYDEDEALADRVREGRKRFEIPADFELAQVSQPMAPPERFEPLQPGAITIVVDARGVRIGGRTFAVGDDGPLRASCALTPVAQALAWERRVWQAAHPGEDPFYTEVDLVIDARTPYRNVLAAWKWLSCERFFPSLVIEGPRGEVGAWRATGYHRWVGTLLVEVSPAGYRVSRRAERSENGVRATLASYGADCNPEADGVSVPLHGDADALEQCVWRAYDDFLAVAFASTEEMASLSAEMRRQHDGEPPGPPPLPPTREERRAHAAWCGTGGAPGIAVGATPETPFRDVAFAIVSSGRVRPFAGFAAEL